MTITLYHAVPVINGWKTAIVLEALNVSYDSKYLDLSKSEQKGAEYKKINPNGRVPTLVDGDFVIWETGAIARYITDKYDKDHKINFPVGTNERYLVEQWLDFNSTALVIHFQATYGKLNAPKKDEEALQAAHAETVRVLQLLDSALEGKTYLVGEKATIADLSYAPWLEILEHIFPTTETAHWAEVNKLKNFAAWRKRLDAHPAVQKVAEIRKKL